MIVARDVERIIKSVIAEQFAYPEDEITYTTHLHEDIGMDSAALAEFMIRLEDTLLIKLPPISKLETIGDLMNCISSEAKGVH